MNLKRHYSGVAAVVFAALLATATPTFASAPLSARASIKTDGGTCQVIGTFSWKNVAEVYDVMLQVFTPSNAPAGEYRVSTTESSGTITMSFDQTVDMNYRVDGTVHTNSAPYCYSDSSRTATLRCR